MSRNFGLHQSRFASSSLSDATAINGRARFPRVSQPLIADKQNVRPALGGIKPPASRHGTIRSADLHPIPAGSLNFAPVDDRTRERAAKIFCTVVLSLCFAIPMMLAGIMLHFK